MRSSLQSLFKRSPCFARDDNFHTFLYNIIFPVILYLSYYFIVENLLIYWYYKVYKILYNVKYKEKDMKEYAKRYILLSKHYSGF